MMTVRSQDSVVVPRAWHFSNHVSFVSTVNHMDVKKLQSMYILCSVYQSKYIQLLCKCSLNTLLRSAPSQSVSGRHLQTDTAISAVLEEETAVDLALVGVGALVSAVHDVRAASGLLQDTDLELTAAGEVDGLVGGYGLELVEAGGVVDGGLAMVCVSLILFLTFVMR